MFPSRDLFVGIKLVMTIIGTWPNETPSLFYLIRRYTAHAFIIANAIMNTMEFIASYNDYNALSKTLYVQLSVLSFMVKFYGFTFNEKVLLTMLKDIDDDSFNYEDRNRDEHLVKISGILSILRRVFIVGSILWFCFFCTFPLIDNKSLPLPFSYNIGNYHLQVYILVCCNIGFVGWGNTSLDLFIIHMMGFIAAQLDALKSKLENCKVDPDGKEDGIEVTLRECVKHHILIDRFVGKLNDVLAVGMLVQLLCVIGVYCNTVFQVFFLVEPFTWEYVMIISYFLVVTQQVFMFCWFGNAITVKSQEVMDSCYASEWYKFSIKNRKYLILMMERAKRPIYVKASKFTYVTLDTLTTIFKWSYSAFALLNKVYSK